MATSRSDGFDAKRRLPDAVALFAAMLALAGCTMIPTYERPLSPVAAAYPGASPPGGSGTDDLGGRDLFVDESLQKLIESALADNRDLRVAMLNVEKTRAQYRVTRAASLPAIDGTGSATRSHGMANDSSRQWSASLGTTAYEIDLWGRVRSLKTQALETYLATGEARRSAQLSLVAAVATEYFTLRQNEELLALSHQTLRAVQEAYDLNKELLNAGASDELDVREAEGQVRTAKLSALTYEREIARATNALVLLIGRPLPAEPPAPRAFTNTNPPAQIPAGLPSDLVERRPDILEAEHALKAANANIGAARAAFFPAISLTASAGASSPELSKLFGSGSGWSFSPQITVPIFTGGRNQANLDAAAIGKRIEIANYEKAIQTAFREVADALVDVSSYAQEIAEEAALVGAQQRRYEIANARYRQGTDTYLSVLTAQQDLFSAQRGLIQAQFNRIAGQISLYKALGGGWKEEGIKR